MKQSPARFLAILACSLLTAAADGQERITETIRFSAPAQYCFRQTEFRGSGFRAILEHHLLVAEEHHFRTGDVFVGARFKSRPGTLLLTSGGIWRDAYGPVLNVYPTRAQIQASSTLQPVTPISVFYHPVDISPYAGDAQILVGYGLRNPNEDARVSFNEMISSRRFDVLWDTSTGEVGVNGISYDICMTTTDMTKTRVIPPTGGVVN